MNVLMPVFKESRIILIAALIQFVNVTDFMMVMPLGPDFAHALSIPMDKIGIVAGSYTIAAALMGIVAAFFLDRFQRRRAILVALAGLVLATAAGAFASDETQMIAARITAGAFGGPVTALGMALIIDLFAPEKRGAAMGKVMGGFALASVFGVPMGLELARHFSWHAPFFSTAALGVVVWVLAFLWLPSYPSKNADTSATAMLKNIRDLLEKPATLLSYAMMGVLMMSGFMIIPNISAYLQFNLAVPREDISLLYLLGGATSFFTMRLAGLLTDRWSGLKTIWLFTGLFIAVLLVGFVMPPASVLIIPLFIGFMVSMTGRGVAAQTLTTKVPPPPLRGAFLSLQSTVTHIATSLGASFSAFLLTSENNVLKGMPTLAFMAIIFALFVPCLYGWIEKKMKV